MQGRRLFFIMAATLSLAGCSTTESTKLPKVGDLLAQSSGQDGRACVRQSEIESFGSSGEVITINGRGKQYYLATTVFRCHGLDLSAKALFQGSFNEVCGGGRSNFVTRDGGPCPIAQIFEYSSREDAFQALNDAKTKLEQLQEAAQDSIEKESLNY